MIPNCWPLRWRQWWWSGPSLPRRNRNISAWIRATTIQLGEKRWRLIATCHTSGALARKSWIPQGCHAIPPGDGWWRTPSHKTPESLWLTEPTPRPMLGISGLLNLLTWVEHRKPAQASPHQEGGNPCAVSHPTRSPPPDSSQGISRWEALPQANRQRLLWQLSHLLERQLERSSTLGKEDDDELDTSTE